MDRDDKKKKWQEFKEKLISDAEKLQSEESETRVFATSIEAIVHHPMFPAFMLLVSVMSDVRKKTLENVESFEREHEMAIDIYEKVFANYESVETFIVVLGFLMSMMRENMHNVEIQIGIVS